jgi:predicted enzyme related to lactoylglutathione lyase
MKITGSNVTVMVKDMDVAIRFYQTIGLDLKQRWENHYAQLAATDIVVGLHPTSDNLAPNKQVSIGFGVKDIAEAKSVLDANKIAYSFEEGKSGKYTHFKDPDGTYLYFTELRYG